MKLRTTWTVLPAAALLAGPLWAQTAPTTADQPASLETVVISGVRQAVKSAPDTKKNATGVQISRNAAESNQLLVRDYLIRLRSAAREFGLLADASNPGRSTLRSSRSSTCRPLTSCWIRFC